MKYSSARVRFVQICFAFTVIVASCAASSAATASTPIGQKCSITSSGPPVMFQSAVSSGTPYAAQTDGVLTKWGVDKTTWMSASILAPAIGQFAGGQWTIVNAAPFQVIPGSSVSEFPTRIPVSTGQSLGLLAFQGVGNMCSGYVGPTGDVIDYNNAHVPVGGSFTPVGTFPSYRLAVFGTLEPDVDKDGYGDETQDACPQSAVLQNACPVLSISQKLSASRSAISVLASASVDTALTAEASVKLPKIGKTKAKTVKFKSKATAFSAGKLKAIRLKLPSRVRKAVKAGKKLKVTVTLTGNGLANTATTKSTIRLKR